jgi:outer membrane protein assembly factor BamB
MLLLLSFYFFLLSLCLPSYPFSPSPSPSPFAFPFPNTTGYFKNGTLYALNETTGDTVWRLDFGEIFGLNPPTYDSGVVYVQRTDINQGGLLYAVDALDGTVKWTSMYTAQWEHYLAPMVADGQVILEL